MITPVRTLVAWCPDWPVVATGVPLDEPSAVLLANRVIAASPEARVHGVVRGLRRRAAQARCPELSVHDRDEAKEARLFEPVVAVLDDITPRVEVARPGVCALVSQGPSRYFGGEEVVAGLVRERMVEQLRPFETVPDSFAQLIETHRISVVGVLEDIVDRVAHGFQVF